VAVDLTPGRPDLAAYGFRWTYGNLDSQHLEGRTTRLAGGFIG